MKAYKMLLAGFAVFMVATTAAIAGDFEWLKDLNIKAQLDPSGFKAQLATRFKIGAAEVNAVIGNVEKSADAYMVLRLGEMSGQPTDTVIKQYQSGKNQGWGVLAKSLGIKPGSREFHALKQGHDLGGGGDGGPVKGKGKGKGKKNR